MQKEFVKEQIDKQILNLVKASKFLGSTTD